MEHTTRAERLFPAIVALFVTCLVVSNVIASKLVTVAGFVAPAGVIVFPVSYILADVLVEVYGLARARRVIWTGLGCNVLALLAMHAAVALPPAPGWVMQDAYVAVLGAAPRVALASLCAYLAGELVNARVMHAMRGGRNLWARIVASTVAGQAVDSTVFVVVAFAGLVPAWTLVGIVAVQWAVKTGYEVLASPLTCAVIARVRA